VAVKLKKITLVCAALLNAPSLFAALPAVECSNDDGFSAKLIFDEGKDSGSLTYGTGEDLQTVDGLATSFYGGVGAAVKGNEVLFVVTPAYPNKLAELVVAGSTYLLQCK
jgi:hypothetical protein